MAYLPPVLDLTAPDPPRNPVASEDAFNEERIIVWDPPLDADLRAVRIYRVLVGYGGVINLTLISEVNLPNTTFSESAALRSYKRYAITSVDVFDYESYPVFFVYDDGTGHSFGASLNKSLPRLVLTATATKANPAGRTASVSVVLPMLAGVSASASSQPVVRTAAFSRTLPELIGSATSTRTLPSNRAASVAGTLPGLSSALTGTRVLPPARTATFFRDTAQVNRLVSGTTAAPTGPVPVNSEEATLLQLSVP